MSEGDKKDKGIKILNIVDNILNFTLKERRKIGKGLKILTPNQISPRDYEISPPVTETMKYWVGVQWGQSYLMGRRCLFSLGWQPF